MERKIIKKILKQDLKKAKKHLKSFEKDLARRRKDKDLLKYPMIIDGLQHPIGYFTALCYHYRQILQYLDMTKEDFDKMFEEDRRSKKEHKKTMKKLFKNIKKKKKSKK